VLPPALGPSGASRIKATVIAVAESQDLIASSGIRVISSPQKAIGPIERAHANHYRLSSLPEGAAMYSCNRRHRKREIRGMWVSSNNLWVVEQ
jgi:hypothetical protein